MSIRVKVKPRKRQYKITYLLPQEVSVTALNKDDALKQLPLGAQNIEFTNA